MFRPIAIVWTCCFALFASLAYAEVDDKMITKTIDQKLDHHSAVPLDSVHITTTDGVVTLAGTVDHYRAKRFCEEIAEGVRGVRSVVNRLEVTPTPRSDAELRRDIFLALREDEAIDHDPLEVEVTDSVVVLSGAAESRAEADLAVVVAAGVAGVKAVKSEIVVNRKLDRTDDEIGLEVAARLSANPWIDAEVINVKVDDGEVTLSGRVPTARQKSNAADLAFVAGAASVDVSELKIDPELVIGAGEHRLTAKNDLQIREGVLSALRYDPRVPEDNVKVVVDQGLVRLAGVVPSLRAKHAVVADARNTVGVWRVEDQLTVKPHQTRSEAELVAAVKAALQRDAIFRDHTIRVDADGNHIWLRGRVENAQQRKQAERLADAVQGVVEVTNMLEVDAADSVTDYDALEIKYGIMNRIYWSPLIDDRHIQVIVGDQGEVTLTGYVDSKQAYRAVSRIAEDAGATKINNRVVVSDR